MLFSYWYVDYNTCRHIAMHEFHCECGWKTGYVVSKDHPLTKRCPACGAELHKFINGYIPFLQNRSKDEKFTFQNVISVSSKAFEMEMFRMLVSCDDTKPLGEQLTQTVAHKYRIKVRLEPQFEIELFDKDVLMKPTLTNIQAAMAHASFNCFPKGSIFSAVKKNANCSSAETICLLKKNPVLEKVFLLDPGMGSLQSYKEILGELDQSQPEPHKAFGLNRLLYKRYIEISKQIHFPLQDLRKMISDFGEQKAESILEYAMQVIETERAHNGYQDNTAFKVYCSLIHRDDIGYDPKTLMEYVTDRIYTYQGIKHPAEGLTLLRDYLDMCSEMNVSSEKYPRSLKLVHDIAVKNHEIFLDEQQRQQFKEIVSQKDYRSLAYQDKVYCVIAPVEPDDLIHEGAALSHCVGSYISKVIKSGVKILFMRKTKDPEKSLITLDVRDQKLFFAAGFDNRTPTDEERAFIMKWLKAKKIAGSLVA